MIEALRWRAGDESGMGLNVLAVAAAGATAVAFLVVGMLLGRSSLTSLSDRDLLMVLVGSVVVLAVHELLHGLVLRGLGARPTYGFYARRLLFYAKAPGHAFGRDAYLAIVLGPLVSLSALALIGLLLFAGTSSAWVIALWAVVNASASNADLRIAALVRRYPRSATVVDERDGGRVLLPPRDSTIS